MYVKMTILIVMTPKKVTNTPNLLNLSQHFFQRLIYFSTHLTQEHLLQCLEFLTVELSLTLSMYMSLNFEEKRVVTGQSYHIYNMC